MSDEDGRPSGWYLFPRRASAYTTGAVSFDGASYLGLNSLTATDNSKLSWSLWYWRNAGPDDNGLWIKWIVDPSNTYQTYSGLYYDDGLYAAISAGADPTPQWATKCGPTVAGALGAWHHELGSIDLTQNPPVGKLVVDGVDVTNIAGLGISAGATLVAFNGLPFIIGSDTFGPDDSWHGYMADVWVAPGQSLLNGSNVIPPATIAKFYSAGKPVDLGADGSTPTGTAPRVFCRRAAAAAASTFATNLGTGGNFTITGTLTNAASSPSD